MNKYNIIRHGDRWKIRGHIDLSQSFDRASIRFYSGEETLNVLNTSCGSIHNNEISVNQKVKFVNAEIEFGRNMSDLECIISYYSPSGVHQEKSPFSVSVKQIDKNIPVVNTIEVPFRYLPNVNEFIKDRGKSKWKINLSIHRDIIASVESNGDAHVRMSFGEESDQPLASDLEFILCPEIEKFVIPCEAIWANNYNNIFLRCFELVQCSGIKNVLYKMPVSNCVTGVDLPQRSIPDISSFKWPTGKCFGPNWSVNNLSGLPQLVRNNE